MERYVTTKYRLHELHLKKQVGYVPTMYPKYKLKCYMFNFKIINFSVFIVLVLG